jgi:4-amino-4-deoxy-L-arabinose transferase-like glycosyltransferase
MIGRPLVDAAALLAISLFLRLWLFCGFGIGDDPGYAFHVHQILTEGYPDIGDNAVFLLRPVLLYPMAVSVRLLGWTEAAFVLPILAASLLGILCTYVLGTLLHGRTAGLLSASALALFPLDLVNSTTVTNDILGSALLGLGAVLALLSFHGRDRERLLLGVLGGLSMGLATAVKLTFAVAVVPLLASLAVGVLRKRLTRRLGIAIAGGWLVAHAGLALFCWVKAGDPLAFVAIELNFNAEMMERHYHPDQLASTLLYYPRMILRLGGTGAYGYEVFPLGWFFFLAFVLLGVAVFSRFRRISMPAAWFLFFMLALQFWPMQVSPFYIPIHRLPRILHLAAIPAALVIGIGFAGLLERGLRWRVAAASAMALYAITSLQSARLSSRRHNDCMRDSRLIARFVEWYDGPVFTDAELRNYLVFSTGFRNADRFRSELYPLDAIWKGSLVVIGGSRRPEIDPGFLETIHPTEIPREWIRVFEVKSEYRPWRRVRATGYIAM